MSTASRKSIPIQTSMICCTRVSRLTAPKAALSIAALFAPPFLHTPHLLAHMQGKQEHPIWSEHAVKPAQDWDHLWAREMANGVEAHDAAPPIIHDSSH